MTLSNHWSWEQYGVQLQPRAWRLRPLPFWWVFCDENLEEEFSKEMMWLLRGQLKVEMSLSNHVAHHFLKASWSVALSSFSIMRKKRPALQQLVPMCASWGESLLVAILWDGVNPNTAARPSNGSCGSHPWTGGPPVSPRFRMAPITQQSQMFADQARLGFIDQGFSLAV